METALQDKVAIVAGPSLRIVNSTVKALLTEGATVVVPARSAGDIQQLREYLGVGVNDKLVTLLVNYPDYEKAFEVRDTINEQFGRIDLAVICFNSLPPGALPELTGTSIIDWDKMVDQNITAFFIAAKVLLKGMIQCRHGSFISVMDCDYPDKECRSPFSSFSSSVQAEMARLFFAEADRFDVNCYHVSINHFGSLPGASSSQRIPNNNIGQFIINLYNNRVAQPAALFRFVNLDPGEALVFQDERPLR